MDLSAPMLLAMTIEIPDAVLVGLGAFMTATGIPALGVAWKWWVKKEEDRAAAQTKVNEGHEKAVVALGEGHKAAVEAVVNSCNKAALDTRERYKVILDAKELYITELGKELSRKSDAIAAKTEELMRLTITKIDEASADHGEILTKTLDRVGEFTGEMRGVKEALAALARTQKQ